MAATLTGRAPPLASRDSKHSISGGLVGATGLSSGRNQISARKGKKEAALQSQLGKAQKPPSNLSAQKISSGRAGPLSREIAGADQAHHQGPSSMRQLSGGLHHGGMQPNQAAAPPDLRKLRDESTQGSRSRAPTISSAAQQRPLSQ